MWKRTQAQCQVIWGVIVENPGSRRAEISQLTGIPRHQVSRLIPKMDECGFTLTENEHRELFAYVHDENDPATVPDFLVRGMGLPPLDTPPERIDDIVYDAITGVGIADGYRVRDIVPKAAGEFLDLLRGNVDGWISEATARAFRGTWNLGNRLIFEDGTHYYPLINLKSAREQNRPCWSELVRKVWDRCGERLLAILTTDFKKRLWPQARIGILGSATAVYLHDANLDISASVWIDWAKMLFVLDLVEDIYRAGFSKSGIVKGILSEYQTAQTVGVQAALNWERRLQTIRGCHEFTMAIIIAQKGE